MYKPMNAKSAGAKLSSLLDNPAYIAELKFDGYRAVYEGGEFYSRLGNPLGAKVPHLVQCLQRHNIVLDGELYIPEGTSNDVNTALGSKGDHSKLRYMVFDALEIGNAVLIGLTWERRREILQRWFDCVHNIDGVELSPTYTDKQGLLSSIEATGAEGIMLKNINSLYHQDKRPEHCWYKAKKSMTYDVVVTGYTEGKGKYKGQVGAVEFALYKEGELTYCGQCSGFTDELRMVMTMHPDIYIGAVMEISAMERTADGMFRHPVFRVFRNDKDKEDCMWQQ